MFDDNRFFELEDKVQTGLIGSKFQGCLATEEILEELTGMKARCYDQYIDDGADDDETEDQYVMCASYQLEDGRTTIRIYYGDVTFEIGYVDVSEC